MQNNKLNPLLVVGLLAVLGIGGYYVYANSANKTANEQSNQPNAVATTTPPQSEMSSRAAGEVVMLNVEAGSFYFKPNELRVKKGQKVKLTLTSVDLMHDFVVDELNIKAPVTTEGNTATVEFTPDKTGTFEYYCSVGNHRKNGQVGTLVVEE